MAVGTTEQTRTMWDTITCITFGVLAGAVVSYVAVKVTLAVWPIVFGAIVIHDLVKFMYNYSKIRFATFLKHQIQESKKDLIQKKGFIPTFKQTFVNILKITKLASYVYTGNQWEQGRCYSQALVRGTIILVPLCNVWYKVADALHLGGE